jgi:hypothetical protein
MSKAKWKWVVVFADGREVNVPVATGARDARMQAWWIIKEETGYWPKSYIVEVQKRPTNDNLGLLYMSYRSKR